LIIIFSKPSKLFSKQRQSGNKLLGLVEKCRPFIQKKISLFFFNEFLGEKNQAYAKKYFHFIFWSPQCENSPQKETMRRRRLLSKLVHGRANQVEATKEVVASQSN